MTKITVVDVRNSLSQAIGTRVKFEKAKSNFSTTQINAFVKNLVGTWELIGVIAETDNIKAPNTVLSKEIYDSMPDEFFGEVVDYGSIASMGNKKSLVVEIETKSGTKNTAKATNGIMLFKFKVKGNTTKYAGKTAVLNDVKNDKVFLNLELGADNSVLLKYNGVPSGIIDEKEVTGCSSLEDLEVIKSLLSSVDLEANVAEASTSSYFIEINVNEDVLEKAAIQVAKTSLAAVKANLATLGYEESNLTAIEDYLLANKFTVGEIAETMEKYRPLDSYSEEAKKLIPLTRPENVFKDYGGILRLAWSCTMEELHILLSGEKGVGKDCLVQTIAWFKQQPLYEDSINRDTDKIDFLGGKIINSYVDPTCNQVVETVEFIPEALLNAMVNGGIMNIDEINFADPGVTGLLHSITDDRCRINVPGYGLVSAAEGFLVIGTMNRDYQGTNELNEALADRFVDIIFPSNESIFDILEGLFPKESKTVLKNVDKIYQKMHEIIDDMSPDLDPKNLTVRGFIQALKISKRYPIKDALISCVANKAGDIVHRQNICDIINSVF